MNRKKFLQLSSLTVGSILPMGNKMVRKEMPIVVSTWDSGMKVNAAAWEILSKKGYTLDAVEKGANSIEDTIDCCVGLGGLPDRDGVVTLDACIMDDKSNCGAVAALERIQHPISVARKIMESTPHILLAGDGAQQFALQNGFTLASSSLSASAQDAYKKWLQSTDYKPEINIENKKNNGPFAPAFFEDGSPNHDTMGLLALDVGGRMSGGVTTSGMAFKMHGRVGDSPIIGAGLFVDNEIGAATSSGVGEEVVRICGTHLVVEFLRQGYTPQDACKKACERIVKRDAAKAKTIQVGFLALDKYGRHGAYSLQKGFVYSIRTATLNKILPAPFIYS